ncbi:uncharacterized protein BO97DRAFT_411828 [Aspergillus homomorphus CBS 101889]|uniref:Uncharacterized protein n=1 Tax=Aspergillus homomorphus (strain CBS 101889) TaxID=1450537 RepID=A0A395I5K7_ASPHC|nr:hypothetical protein BO97DRAFT_411828 [Aspergillus homomorphus CBS 101889]RAL15056.1 hypothetical protein BO97DRAFT_411828 [Aspergillus homomorphus CBS 101889]
MGLVSGRDSKAEEEDDVTIQHQTSNVFRNVGHKEKCVVALGRTQSTTKRGDAGNTNKSEPRKQVQQRKDRGGGEAREKKGKRKATTTTQNGRKGTKINRPKSQTIQMWAIMSDQGGKSREFKAVERRDEMRDEMG